MLPVIADIEGALGETFDEDKGEQAFTSGIKLKLNGPVQTHKGEAVFDYYLTLLDPGSEEHKQRMSDSRFEDKKVKEFYSWLTSLLYCSCLSILVTKGFLYDEGNFNYV